MPLVVLYVLTDSGNIIVNRPVPFRLVKEVWFCVYKALRDQEGFV